MPKSNASPATSALRGKFFTVVHGAVESCGHLLGLNDEPTFRNCEHCWFAYFSSHADLVSMTGKIMATDGGRDSVVRIKGTKFVQMFLRFVKTLERLKGVEGEQRTTIQSNRRFGESVG